MFPYIDPKKYMISNKMYVMLNFYYGFFLLTYYYYYCTKDLFHLGQCFYLLKQIQFINITHLLLIDNMDGCTIFNFIYNVLFIFNIIIPRLIITVMRGHTNRNRLCSFVPIHPPNHTCILHDHILVNSL